MFVTESLPGQFNLGAPGSRAEPPGHISDGAPADSSVGDFETAFATAPVNIEAIYTTPYRDQAPMEPHATMAVWEGQFLTVHTSAQLTTSPQEGLARTLNIPKENVRVITRYVGGGFGNKLPFYVDATLAAIGARFLRRPVKVAMTRPQLFHMTTHRTAGLRAGSAPRRQPRRPTDRLRAGRARAMRALRPLPEPVCRAARMLYAAPNRLTRHRLSKLDLPRSDSMRDPGDAIGLLALECAMDELAERSATARARLESDGRLTVELAMTDIGTGTYTILTQVAAEAMELPVDRVTVRLGDTRFPPTAGSGGSFGAATSGAAVLAACRKLNAGLALRNHGSRGISHPRGT